MNPLTLVILNFGIVILLKYSGVKVESGNLTTGEVAALYNYMTQILVELVKFASLIITISKSISCMKRINEVLETEPAMVFPETSASEDSSAPAIEFDSVSLKYSTAAEESLTNISFKINKGETVGIIGGTGCGKTSLINLIVRFYDATSGKVLVNGTDVKDYTAKDLRDKIGYVLQKVDERRLLR